jgi:Domain of unknown function (DUF1707)
MDRVLAGDRDRERAVATLKGQYAGGRLTLDELSERVDRVLAARSRAELQGTLAGLPVFPDPREIAARGRSMARSAVRGVVLAFFTGAYFLFTFMLLLVLAVTMLVHEASSAVLVGFLVVWLVPTVLLTRLWHRSRRPEPR